MRMIEIDGLVLNIHSIASLSFKVRDLKDSLAESTKKKRVQFEVHYERNGSDKVYIQKLLDITYSDKKKVDDAVLDSLLELNGLLITDVMNFFSGEKLSTLEGADLASNKSRLCLDYRARQLFDEYFDGSTKRALTYAEVSVSDEVVTEFWI